MVSNTLKSESSTNAFGSILHCTMYIAYWPAHAQKCIRRQMSVPRSGVSRYATYYKSQKQIFAFHEVTYTFHDSLHYQMKDNYAFKLKKKELQVLFLYLKKNSNQ